MSQTSMNPFREAALAMAAAEDAHPGLIVNMEITHQYVQIRARRRTEGYARLVTWTEIEGAKFNILTATVVLVVNRIMGERWQ